MHADRWTDNRTHIYIPLDNRNSPIISTLCGPNKRLLARAQLQNMQRKQLLHQQTNRNATTIVVKLCQQRYNNIPSSKESLRFVNYWPRTHTSNCSRWALPISATSQPTLPFLSTNRSPTSLLNHQQHVGLLTASLNHRHHQHVGISATFPKPSSPQTT